MARRADLTPAASAGDASDAMTLLLGTGVH